MKNFAKNAAIAAMLASAPMVAFAGTTPVTFPAGSTGTTVKGKLTGDETMLYTLQANKGQSMSVKLHSTSTAPYFNIYKPGDKPGEADALFDGSTSADGNTQITLPETGKYTVQVYLYRNAASAGKSAEYSLDLSVTDGHATKTDGNAHKGAMDNGMLKAPGTYHVTGVSNLLNLRADTSTDSMVVAALRKDTPVNMTECKMVGSMEWCKVETTGNIIVKGWAAGQYLTK